jgi:hypothetical protein
MRRALGEQRWFSANLRGLFGSTSGAQDSYTRVHRAVAKRLLVSLAPCGQSLPAYPVAPIASSHSDLSEAHLRRPADGVNGTQGATMIPTPSRSNLLKFRMLLEFPCKRSRAHKVGNLGKRQGSPPSYPDGAGNKIETAKAWSSTLLLVKRRVGRAGGAEAALE